jgi:rare lipoprotein A
MSLEAPLRAAALALGLLALSWLPAQAAVHEHGKISGIASWYGREHQGMPTASGEAFDRRELTAAHRSLPLGTVLRVTNPANGRQVTVRVNDRGPYVRGRMLDLSEKAARALGIVDRGKARVEMEVTPATGLTQLAEAPESDR